MSALKRGDRVRYTNRGGWSAVGKIIDFELVDEEGDGGKNHRDVYDVELDAPIGGETSYWGYRNQFAKVA
jgi:hypothetical protein